MWPARHAGPPDRSSLPLPARACGAAQRPLSLHHLHIHQHPAAAAAAAEQRQERRPLLKHQQTQPKRQNCHERQQLQGQQLQQKQQDWSASQNDLEDRPGLGQVETFESEFDLRIDIENLRPPVAEAPSMGRTRKVAPSSKPGNKFVDSAPASMSGPQQNLTQQHPTAISSAAQPSPRSSVATNNVASSGGGSAPKYYCRACNELFPNWSQCLNHVRTAEADNDPELFKLTTTPEGRRELQKVSKYVSGDPAAASPAGSALNTPAPTPPVTPRNTIRTPTPTGTSSVTSISSDTNNYRPHVNTSSHNANNVERSRSRPELCSSSSSSSIPTSPECTDQYEYQQLQQHFLPPPPSSFSNQAPENHPDMHVPKPQRMATNAIVAQHMSGSTSANTSTSNASSAGRPSSSGGSSTKSRMAELVSLFSSGSFLRGGSSSSSSHSNSAASHKNNLPHVDKHDNLTATASAAASAAPCAAQGSSSNSSANMNMNMNLGQQQQQQQFHAQSQSQHGFVPLQSPLSAASLGDLEDHVSIGSSSSVTITPDTTPQSSPMGDERFFEFGDCLAGSSQSLHRGLMVPQRHTTVPTLTSTSSAAFPATSPCSTTSTMSSSSLSTIGTQPQQSGGYLVARTAVGSAPSSSLHTSSTGPLTKTSSTGFGMKYPRVRTGNLASLTVTTTTPTAAGMSSASTTPSSILSSASSTSYGSSSAATTPVEAFTPSVSLVLNQGNNTPGSSIRSHAQLHAKRASALYTGPPPPGFRSSSSSSSLNSMHPTTTTMMRNKSTPTLGLLSAEVDLRSDQDEIDHQHHGQLFTKHAAASMLPRHLEIDPNFTSFSPSASATTTPTSAAFATSVGTSAASVPPTPSASRQPVYTLKAMPDVVATRICEFLDLGDCASLSQAILLE